MSYIKKYLISNKIEFEDVEVLTNLFESLGNQQEIKKVFVHINEYLKDEGVEYSIWEMTNERANMIWYKGDLQKKKAYELNFNEIYGKRALKQPEFNEDSKFKVMLPIVTRERVVGMFCLHNDIEDKSSWKKIYVINNLLKFILNYYTLIEDTQDYTTKDFVTGLYNRRHFHMQINIDIEKVKRFKKPLTSVGVKIKDYDEIISKFGYEPSEDVLREFTRILKLTTRETDMPARLGEEYFGILMYETSSSGAEEFIKRLRNILDNFKISVNGVEFNLEIEPSIVEYKKDMTSEEMMAKTKNF